ncbi:MAG: hypothetical protein U0M10_00325, partial [Oscillospiraceae bacterium]|nr:hypothetical protein [Oscillospiraceae bacterium]
MPNPICPLCGQTLATGTSPWRCPNGHCFDVARQGYVNLLPVQQKHARHPGDTPAQVAARKRFLDAGFYAPIRDTALALLQPHLPPRPSLLDAGCGEGYYAKSIAAEMRDSRAETAGRNPAGRSSERAEDSPSELLQKTESPLADRAVIALDLSKAAVKCASRGGND